MAFDRLDRRLSYVLLCVTPFLVAILTNRALRIRGVYQAIGGVLAIAIALAAWTLGARALRAGAEDRRRLALAGGLLIASWAAFALAFPGIGAPWQATAAENKVRYLALVVAGIFITGGFVALREALRQTGERFYSTIGFAAALLAGPTILHWTSFQLGGYVAKEQAGAGQLRPMDASLSITLDVLLFFGVVLTYVATAAFAISLGRSQWLGRRAARAFAITNCVALVFVAIRGLQFPDPETAFQHWYDIPGFVAGIPAIPYIMPCLLGAVLLRRAGDEQW